MKLALCRWWRRKARRRTFNQPWRRETGRRGREEARVGRRGREEARGRRRTEARSRRRRRQASASSSRGWGRKAATASWGSTYSAAAAATTATVWGRATSTTSSPARGRPSASAASRRGRRNNLEHEHNLCVEQRCTPWATSSSTTTRTAAAAAAAAAARASWWRRLEQLFDHLEHLFIRLEQQPGFQFMGIQIVCAISRPPFRFCPFFISLLNVRGKILLCSAVLVPHHDLFFLGGGPSRAVTTGGWQERLTKSWKNGTKEVAVATREEEVDLKDLVVEAATREEGV